MTTITKWIIAFLMHYTYTQQEIALIIKSYAVLQYIAHRWLDLACNTAAMGSKAHTHTHTHMQKTCYVHALKRS